MKPCNINQNQKEAKQIILYKPDNTAHSHNTNQTVQKPDQINQTILKRQYKSGYTDPTKKPDNTKTRPN